MLALLAFACILLGGPLMVQASPKTFAQADAAWHKGELEESKSLYEKALAAGGLEPSDVVIAYSRVGTVKAALRDKEGALSAFRIAAAIDPEFELPPDSGPVAKKLYDQARSEAAAWGEKLTIAVEAPDEISPGKAFSVTTKIPEGFAVLVAEVAVTVEDPVTKKKWRRKQASQPELKFEFPQRVAIKGARLKVIAEAIDSQNNAWAVSESTLKVEGKRPVNTMDGDTVSPFEQNNKQPKKDGGGKNIFAGPIPWIVGGAVLVAGIIIFAATRPSDEVSVGAPSWQ